MNLCEFLFNVNRFWYFPNSNIMHKYRSRTQMKKLFWIKSNWTRIFITIIFIYMNYLAHFSDILTFPTFFAFEFCKQKCVSLRQNKTAVCSWRRSQFCVSYTTEKEYVSCFWCVQYNLKQGFVSLLFLIEQKYFFYRC